MNTPVRKVKIHIAMIGHKRVPSREGGVEVVVWELSKRFKHMGYDVDCYNRWSPDFKHPEYEHIKGKQGKYIDGIRIFTIPTFQNSKLNAIVYSVFATLRAVFEHYDVIHYHAEGPCLMLWLPKLCGIRTVATIHGLDWKRAKWGGFATRMLLLGEKIAAKHADEVIVLSRNVQNYFLAKYGRVTHYIPNEQNHPIFRKPSLITARYGLQGGDYIMSLCRLVPEKGLHYLVEAFLGMDTDCRLVIAGGTGGKDDYANELRKTAQGDDRIIFTGFVSGELLEELLTNAMVFCQASDVEGMALSLLEAMGYGRCCLVSDIAENLEVVTARDDSLVADTFTHSDPESLREHLNALLQDETRRTKLGELAKAHVQNNIGWDKAAELTEALYLGLPEA